ncbi:MAG: hypothetical protein KQH57_18660 [Actinomycetales bacterium]|nr:hypothetical protein [Actinomycetales bacterium]
MTATTPAPVRFPRAEHRGVLLGLSGPQLAVVAVALVIAGSAVYLGGVTGMVLAAALWLPLMLVGTMRVAGRPVIRWVPLLADWSARRGLGRTAAVESTRAISRGDELVLPGIPRPLTVFTTPNLAAAVVLDRAAGTLTAVARVTSAGFLLADTAAQDHRVAAWGRVLGSLSQSEDVVRLQVMHRSRPASVDAALSDDEKTPDFAARVVAQLAASTRADQRETFVAIAMRAGRTRRGSIAALRLADVDTRLTALGTALASADLQVAEWLDGPALRWAVRASYEPDAARLPTAMHGPTGPVAARERWNHLETDGAVHAVHWVSEWPRSEVNPGFLQALLAAPGVRCTVSLTVEPLSPAAALRQIRRAKAEQVADTAQRAKLGQVEDEATRAEHADLARREAELVAGHGDLRFTGLVTVTAATADELASVGAAMRSAAAQAMCEVRRLDGQHGLAHAAGALPLARRLL